MSRSSSFCIMHHFGGFAVVSAKTACMLFGRSFSQIFCPQSYFFHKPWYFYYAIFHNARTRLSHYNRLACVTNFVWIWEQTAIIYLYSINWLVCITETEYVYCAVRTGSLYIVQVMCFVWIWEQTAIISLYSINWLVFITKTGCVYCAVRTGSLYIIQVLCGSENKQQLFSYTALTGWFV